MPVLSQESVPPEGLEKPANYQPETDPSRVPPSATPQAESVLPHSSVRYNIHIANTSSSIIGFHFNATASK